MPLTDKLRTLRSKSGESLQQVGDAIKVSKAHIWELETGRSRNPSLDILKALAAHFGVSLSYLAEDVPDDTEKAGSFFRRNEAHIGKMTDDELAIIEGLMRKFTDDK